MSVTTRNGISGSGFISDKRTDDGLLKVHGIALGDNDVTIGAKSGEKKLWRPEVLEESAYLLEGRDIVVDHENRSARETVGQVTDAKYKEGVGVIYQGVVQDDELEPKIEHGWLDVSPKLLHSESYDEVGDMKAPEKIHDFPNLSIVRKGASPSNELVAGEHDEFSVEELQSAFDSQSDGVEEYHITDEELQTLPEDVDYSRWMYDNPEAAQGATEKFPCDGIHEHEIQGETWYMPCDSHDSFLSALDEVNEEELQLSEARTPEYSGTETSSWGDVSKTLETFLSGVSGETSDVESVDDLTQEQKNDLSSHTLLGDPEGETFDEIVFFPVVNPNNGNLNRGALEAVRGGRGQSADIPQSAMESAFRIAGRLLNEEFDADVEEEMTYSSVYEAVESVEMQLQEEDLDAVYSDWEDAVNMTASELRNWSGNPCSREASVDPEAVIERNLNLLETPKSDWGEDEIEDANRTISFISRMRGEGNQPDEPRDGPFGCPSEWAISLLNWAYNPFDSLPSVPDNDDLDSVEELSAHSEEMTQEERRVASMLSSHSSMTKKDSMGLVSSVNPNRETDVNSLAKVLSISLGAHEEEMRQFMERMAKYEDEMSEDDVKDMMKRHVSEKESELNKIFG